MQRNIDDIVRQCRTPLTFAFWPGDGILNFLEHWEHKPFEQISLNLYRLRRCLCSWTLRSLSDIYAYKIF